MSKQTFTTGQVLTAAQMTSLQQTALGGGAASAKTASYTLVAADAGTAISMTSASATTITVNTGLFSAGDTVLLQNLGAGVCTVTAGTATVNTAGSLALAQYEAGVLYFISASSAVLFDYTQSGAVSPLTTKGDLYGFSTLDARIPIGANNTVLTADSAQSLGLKWAAPASPSFVGWYLYNSAVQSLADSTNTDITMDSEFYDTNGFHTGSSATVTIPSGQGGKYLIVGCVTYAANATGQRYALIDINGNGATQPQIVINAAAAGIVSVLIVNVWDLAAGDTVKLEGRQNSGGNLNVVVQNRDITYFSGAKIG